jgi:hypothetical protein
MTVERKLQRMRVALCCHMEKFDIGLSSILFQATYVCDKAILRYSCILLLLLLLLLLRTSVVVLSSTPDVERLVGSGSMSGAEKRAGRFALRRKRATLADWGKSLEDRS